MDPKAVDDFIVPLRHDDGETSFEDEAGFTVGSNDNPAQGGIPDNVLQIAGLHHVSYLRAVNKELDDWEFSAAALGVLDGTVQAYELGVSDIEMFTAGTGFVAAQLQSLGRMTDVDPEWIAEVTLPAPR